MPRRHAYGVPERIGPDGQVRIPLDEARVAAVKAARARADLYAGAAGLRLALSGDVTSLDPHFLNAAPNNTVARHVHVGVRGADRAVRVCDRLRPVLPTLLAASVNSPFLEGADSGLRSARTQTFTRSFPRCGDIPDIEILVFVKI